LLRFARFFNKFPLSAQAHLTHQLGDRRLTNGGKLNKRFQALGRQFLKFVSKAKQLRVFAPCDPGFEDCRPFFCFGARAFKPLSLPTSAPAFTGNSFGAAP
jgi:hypothetical protein